TSTATIADVAIVAKGGLTLNAVEGTMSASQAVATFTDPGGAEALTDYSADIDWGDQTTSPGTITFASNSKTFTVSGSHLYVNAGAYPIGVTIHPDTAADSMTSGTAKVADPSVVAVGGVSFSGVEGVAEPSQPVATFTDPAGAADLSHYSADIDWGDGSNSK